MDAWMRDAFEKAWDPAWTTRDRGTRARLLRTACLRTDDPDVRLEVRHVGDEGWLSALDDLEREFTILLQSQAERGAPWVDVAILSGPDAINDAMTIGGGAGAEGVRIYKHSGSRILIATKPRMGRWVLHTHRDL
jgi:hypothetical protein